jgi:WD40 repeat protein
MEIILLVWVRIRGFSFTMGRLGNPRCKLGRVNIRGVFLEFKVWDVEAGKAVQTWRFGGEGNVSILDHQVGVVWPAGRSDGMVISLNLAGDLNYLVEGSQTPTRVVQGHNKSITALGSSHDAKGQTFWTGSFDGRVCSWDVASGIGSTIEGQSHTNQVTAFQTTSDRAYSVGWDDTLRIADGAGKTFLGETSKLSAQPKGLASAEGRVFAATASGIDIFSKDTLVGTVQTKDFTPTAIAASKSLVAGKLCRSLSRCSCAFRTLSRDSRSMLHDFEPYSLKTSWY